MTTCYYAKSNNNHVGSNEYEKAYKKHKRDTFHAWMLRDVNFSEGWEMPLVSATSVRPRSLIPFSVAIDKRCTEYGSFVHFYEDDFRFERVWNYPKRYLSRLSKFAGVVMPDFSTCIDFPKPLKMWNAYRNQLLAAWWQECGITVLPNARHEPDCDWLIEALPKHSSIAICGRALVKNVEERRRFVRDLQTTIDVLEPTFIAYYGSDSYNVLDYPRSLAIPLTVYEGQGRGICLEVVVGSGRGNYPTGKNGNGTSGAKDDGYRKVSGRTTKINADKQKKHIPGARNYLPGRSIFSGSVEHAQQLLSEFAGTGERISSDRERVNFGQTIGTYRSGPNDPGIKTTIGIIMYSKTGAHIVPARPKER